MLSLKELLAVRQKPYDEKRVAFISKAYYFCLKKLMKDRNE